MSEQQNVESEESLTKEFVNLKNDIVAHPHPALRACADAISLSGFINGAEIFAAMPEMAHTAAEILLPTAVGFVSGAINKANHERGLTRNALCEFLMTAVHIGGAALIIIGQFSDNALHRETGVICTGLMVGLETAVTGFAAITDIVQHTKNKKREQILD